MPEEVVIDDSAETPEVAPEAAPEASPAEESVTTWKARLAGKDRALSQTKKELDALKAQADELARWKAAKEEADMTEVEKFQRRIAALEGEAAAAKAEAAKVRLQAQFPKVFDLLGDKTPLDDEAWLAEREARLSAGEEPEAPRIDPNRPRRSAPLPPKDETADDILARLKTLGNPFNN